MAIILGIDLGTTKITALALEVPSGNMLACASASNQADITAPEDKARGYSEWDARRIADAACSCLRQVSEQLAVRKSDLFGIGITGQQHGVVVVDDRLRALTPLVNWQDRRGEECCPGTHHTYVQRSRNLVGADGPRRAGCMLATGYMGVTLFWMKESRVLPQTGIACFIMDYFGALLSGTRPLTDPTCAASSGMLDVAGGSWDRDMIAALGLPAGIFPEVRMSGERLGLLTEPFAKETGLPPGLPVFGGIGDNQASFVGSVGDAADTVLVNVGTGGQVAVYSDRFSWDAQIETRPFPRGGYLFVSAGLAGGASYAVLERFYRDIGFQLFGVQTGEALFGRMNELAAGIPPGAGGLTCEPIFSGTRSSPELRASWHGASTVNFTPAHMVRALMEGMARTFREGFEILVKTTGRQPTRLVGAGNGLRENAVLRGIVADAFGMSIVLPRHREEAAVGAALVAAVSAGVFADLSAAGKTL